MNEQESGGQAVDSTEAHGRAGGVARLRAGIVRILDWGESHREWLVVALLVASSVLSAASFYQATRFGDLSAHLLNEVRFAEAQEASWQSSLEARIVHDRRVLLACQDAINTREEKLREYSATFDRTALHELITAEQTRIALQSLLMADSRGYCGGYEVGRAQQVAAFVRPDSFGEGGIDEIRDRAQQYDDAETLALWGAVVFAVVLLLVTLADATRRAGWLGLWAAGALVTTLLGLAKVGEAFLVARESPLELGGALLAVGLLLGIAAVLMRTTLGPGSWLASLRQSRAGGPLRQEARWWASIFGAISLVIFAVAALGYSLSSTEQKLSIAAADRLTLQARQAVDLGEESALAVLSFTAKLAELDARFAGAAQRPGGQSSGVDGRSPAHQQARDALLGDQWRAEQAAWETLLQSQTATTAVASGAERASPCLTEELILPWQVATDGADPLPAVLLRDARSDNQALSHFVTASGRAALVCSTGAAILWEDAQAWRTRAAQFTVALVVLGLAGFLFGLASDQTRRAHPRRWLLSSALLGMTLGMGLNLAAWNNSPATLDQDDADTGIRAYADSRTALAVGDCATAASRAEAATAALGDFGPAHLAAAYAAACDPEAAWLISPAMSAAQLTTFRTELEAAKTTQTSDDSLATNLGWAHLLAGLQGPSGEPDGVELAAGIALTSDAVTGNPSNPVACFNLALGTLASGDAILADERYAAALASLNRTPHHGECGDAAFDTPFLRTWLRLSALADLELIGDDSSIGTIREMIVASAIGAANGPPAAPDLDGARLLFTPQTIALWTTDPSASVSIVWYYRASDEPWAVLLLPSMSTADPGLHLGRAFPLARALPVGEYRADVYAGGRLAGRISAANDWWSVRDQAPAGFQWIQAPDLGISAVIPHGWQLCSSLPGVEVVYRSACGNASGADGLALRRVDGSAQEDLERQLEDWSGRVLGEWGVPPPYGDWRAQDPAGYLAFPSSVVAHAEGGPILGAGHAQYLVADDRFLGSVTDPSCPGTALMTVVHSDDPAVAETIWVSQVREMTHTATVAGIDLASPFDTSPHFSISFPAGWQAAACPARFLATESGGLANLIVTTEDATDPLKGLADYVAESLELFANPTEFPDFELVNRRAITLAAGIPAERIDFGWTTADGVAVTQYQVYALSRQRLYVLTFTTAAANQGNFEAEWQLMLDSFRPLRGGPPIPADCEGCTDAELDVRQAQLNRLANLMVAIDPRSCFDDTDTSGAETLAFIRCTFPGGFRVDYAAWPDAASLQGFTDRVADSFDASTTTWTLHTGVTAGTLLTGFDGDDARRYWTYDDLLITANAALSDRDETRLLNWWNTVGALLVE